MKKIRIGAGSGGCSFERMEPAMELLEKGGLNYIVFECLAERTMAEAQMAKLKDPDKGYNPMLEERMEQVLPAALAHGTKVISNMGGANVAAAAEKIAEIAKAAGLSVKIAYVTGDDLTGRLPAYQDVPLWNGKGTLKNLQGVISANAYLGSDAIAEALKDGADVVITGRHCFSDICWNVRRSLPADIMQTRDTRMCRTFTNWGSQSRRSMKREHLSLQRSMVRAG